MLYYSMQIIWPRQSALLYVPEHQPILRGVYANLTLMGAWGEGNQYFYAISASEF